MSMKSLKIDKFFYLKAFKNIIITIFQFRKAYLKKKE